MADFLSSVERGATRPSVDGSHKDAAKDPEHLAEVNRAAKQERADLLCPICEEVLYQPVRTACSHRFCLACLSIWLEESAGRTCPLCRRPLCAAGPAHVRASALFAVDAELERRARAVLGDDAYNGRALDALGPKLGKKLESYRRKQERLTSGSDVARAGLGLGAVTVAATAWGAGAASYLGTFASAQAALASGGLGLLVGAHSVASVAFWTTAFSADVLADAVLAGALTGVSMSAFLWGMKFAAWFDGKGKYCILRGCPAPEEGGLDRCIRLLNLLDGDIKVRVFAARKRRHRGSVMDYVAEHAGVAKRQRGSWTLAAEGEPLVELCVAGRREAALRLPPGASRRLLLAVTLQGLVLDRDVGFCGARTGQRFVVGEIDGPAGKVFRRWAEAHAEYRSVAASGASSSSAPSGVQRTSVGDAVREAISHMLSAEQEPAPCGAEAAVAEDASPHSSLDRRGLDGAADAAAGTSRRSACEDADDGLMAAVSRLLGLDRGLSSGEEAEVSSEEEEEPAAAVGSSSPTGLQWQRQRWDDRRFTLGRARPSVQPAVRPVAQFSMQRPSRWRPSTPAAAAGAGAPAAGPAPRLWLCRHGAKECGRARATNWEILLTPEGAAEVEAAARRLAAQRAAAGSSAAPRRVVCSPFPRCLVTAGIYARVLALPSVCIEPGLCEVLSVDKGAKGLQGPRPTWTAGELLGVLAASGAEGVGLDEGHVPVVSPEELHFEASEVDRSEVESRIGLLASRVKAGAFDGDLLVTHGSPAYRLVRALTAERTFMEPPMGSVIELVRCPGSGGSWGRVESFECPGGSSLRRA